MKVSAKSWHYRLLNKLDMYHHHKQYSVCVYFWKVVWAVVLAVLILPVLAIVAVAVCTSPLWWWASSDWPLSATAIAGAFDIWVLCFLWKEYRSDLRRYGKLPEKEPKQPSLAAQWLRAKKQKVCPLIELQP